MSRPARPSAPEAPRPGERLRVLHVIPYFPPSQAGGGIREAVACLARAQADAGCLVTVATTDVGTPGARRPDVPFPGLEVIAFRNLSNMLAWDDVTLPLGLRTWARRRARGFDAVHLHGHRHLAAVLVARARAPLPFVLSPHGTALRIERREGMKSIFDRLSGHGILKGAARILAVSETEMAQLREIGVPESRLRRIPNPLDENEILPLPAQGTFRRKHGIAATSRIVLFLGRVTPNKRVGVLLEAVAPLPEVVLVVAGPDGGALGPLRRAARSAGLGGRAIFTGALDANRRREALADAEIVALPSEHEIFGLAPMEGLLAGAVPIVSEGTGCAERIRAWDAGHVVDGSSPVALREAVRAAMEDAEGSRARAARGAEGVRRELRPGAVAAQVIAAYREVSAPATARTRQEAV